MTFYSRLSLAAAGLALLTLSACTAEKTPSSIADASKSRAANIEIIRDDYGVPHIYGKTDADAVFGMLYAQAEDDFNRIERNYIWAIGRLAEVEGESAIYSDLRAQLYMTTAQAKAAYEAAPAALKELCDAYAEFKDVPYYRADVEARAVRRYSPGE